MHQSAGRLSGGLCREQAFVNEHSSPSRKLLRSMKQQAAPLQSSHVPALTFIVDFHIMKVNRCLDKPPAVILI